MNSTDWEKYIDSLKGKYVVLYNNKIGKILRPYEKQTGMICFELDNDESNNEYNLLDLQVGTEPVDRLVDLVSIGDLMYIDISPDDCGGIVVPRIAETPAELLKFKEQINSGNNNLVGLIKFDNLINNTFWDKGENINVNVKTYISKL